MTDQTENLATKYLREHGETIADWDGDCGGLADAVYGPGDNMIYVDGDIPWKYHMAPLISGLVHDAWCGGPALPLAEWLAKMFDDSEVTVALSGEDIYSGPANEFREKQPKL